jgi:rhodanese-related sulfurtransferase
MKNDTLLLIRQYRRFGRIWGIIMKMQKGWSPARLLGKLSLGIFAWLAVLAGTGSAMAPPNNQYRQEAIEDIYANYKKCFPEVPEVKPAEAMKLLQEGQAVLVDVRPEKERQVSILPGAITAAQFLAAPESYRGKTVIAYDTVGYRSGLFAQKIQKQGIHVANLAGGMLGWLHAGGKLYDDRGETRRVHVYSSMWNYAPGNCEAMR